MSGDKNLNPTTNDPRFSGIHSDPKFKDAKPKNLKIKLDDRFSKKDLEIKKKAKVDKYGRRLKDVDNKETKDFERYFEKEEESSSPSDEEGESTKVTSLDRARGEVPSDYLSSSEEESSSESEEESENSELESEESDLEIEESKPPTGDATRMLAVVNLDWDHVKSTDLMVTFSSFVPKGGKILKIAIYPSEFGKERMQREEVEGPPRELFQGKKKKSQRKDGDDSDVDIKDLYEEGDAEKDYDSKALRRYQLDRLRYYYAVVFCNNVETAEAIYQNCDGTEYESTANMFDLRYVPEGMDFSDEPKDECEDVPKNYKPAQFSTDALQHSNVKLTWDETPAERVEMSKRAFTQKEIEDMDFKAYLASDSEGSEEEINEDSRNKLKSLVGESIRIGDKSLFDKSDNEGGDVDMEITFTPGLDETKKDDEDGKDETTIEKIRRKEKERRKMRKERIKELKKKAEEKKREKLNKSDSQSKTADEVEKEKKSKAELELLMMDDDNDTESKLNKKAHFNMTEILRSEKEKGKRTKYQNREKIVEDEFKPDLNDPRFREVFEDHDFAIDPSQPEFKGTTAMKEILKERNQRVSKKKGNKKRKLEQPRKNNNSNELNGLVAKLKRRNKKSRK